MAASTSSSSKRRPRGTTAPGPTPEAEGALAGPHDSGPTASGGEGQPVGLRVDRLDGPIEQLLVDADDAHSTWRILQPVADQAIGLLRKQLEASAEGNEIDLGQAQKLLTTISSASKALASAAATITSSFERLTEVRRVLGGGGRDLSKLSESELRAIVVGVADELRLTARRPQITVEAEAVS